MRIKVPEDRQSKKPHFSSDAAILVALLKKQPQGKSELIKNSGISGSSFSRDEPLLLREGAMKIIEEGYVLSNYEKIDVDINEIFMILKGENRVEVTLEELANRMGKPPNTIIDQAYRLGKLYNIHIS